MTTNSFSITASEVTSRILKPDDAEAFRSIQLELLRHAGVYKGPAYRKEVRQSTKEWGEQCRMTSNKAVFGLFHGEYLIGTAIAREFEKDVSRTTALWESAYVKTPYRNQGLARSLYKARMRWTAEHPTYKGAVVFIHEDNKRSQDIHLKHGAKLMGTVSMGYPYHPSTPHHCYYIPMVKPQ